MTKLQMAALALLATGFTLLGLATFLNINILGAFLFTSFASLGVVGAYRADILSMMDWIAKVDHKAASAHVIINSLNGWTSNAEKDREVLKARILELEKKVESLTVKANFR